MATGKEYERIFVRVYLTILLEFDEISISPANICFTTNLAVP
jgi:hypothetical protein